MLLAKNVPATVVVMASASTERIVGVPTSVAPAAAMPWNAVTDAPIMLLAVNDVPIVVMPAEE